MSRPDQEPPTTSSLVAVDRATGHVGVAAASQAMVDPDLAFDGLTLMAEG